MADQVQPQRALTRIEGLAGQLGVEIDVERGRAGVDRVGEGRPDLDVPDLAELDRERERGVAVRVTARLARSVAEPRLGAQIDADALRHGHPREPEPEFEPLDHRRAVGREREPERELAGVEVERDRLAQAQRRPAQVGVEPLDARPRLVPDHPQIHAAHGQGGGGDRGAGEAELERGRAPLPARAQAQPPRGDQLGVALHHPQPVDLGRGDDLQRQVRAVAGTRQRRLGVGVSEVLPAVIDVDLDPGQDQAGDPGLRSIGVEQRGEIEAQGQALGEDQRLALAVVHGQAVDRQPAREAAGDLVPGDLGRVARVPADQRLTDDELRDRRDPQHRRDQPEHGEERPGEAPPGDPQPPTPALAGQKLSPRPKWRAQIGSPADSGVSLRRTPTSSRNLPRMLS